MTLLKYKVKHTSIMHNGTVYKESSTIELDENQAKRLEDFVELLPNQSAPAKSKAQTQTSNKTASTGNKKSENKTTAKNQTKAETKTETESGTVTAEEESKEDEKGGSDDNK